MYYQKYVPQWNFSLTVIKMYDDEVILEVWKNRKDYSDQHGGDLAAIVADLERRQEEAPTPVVDRRKGRRKNQTQRASQPEPSD